MSPSASHQKDPIVALTTPPGRSAIAVIRLSGKGVIDIVNQVFHPKNLTNALSHTLHVGTITNQEETLDEVVVAIFRAPKSFTCEDVIEISCHGNPFIAEKILSLFLQKGIRLANPGEFTQRAFLHGRLDLTQAEAVADVIAAESSVAHQTALRQMKGGLSTQIQLLRTQLVHFASMIELELDFAEEDVQFADQKTLQDLVQKLLTEIEPLIQSFSLHNALKQGIPVVIAGKPNTGKSTLLNTLLQEEKAIVSAIPGTTRDSIEGMIYIHGIGFRLIDTAGLRHVTTDSIETIGIQRTKEQIQKASLLIYLFDLSTESLDNIQKKVQELEKKKTPLIKVGNKVDIAPAGIVQQLTGKDFLLVSANAKETLSALQSRLTDCLIADQLQKTDTVVVNARHYECLQRSKKALQFVLQGVQKGLTQDLLAQDLRNALHHLGTITGEVTTEELLHHLFSKFCIGK